MTASIRDVTDEAAFGRIPPCADPGFDHRTCDYWEDAGRGSKAHRPGWLGMAAGSSATSASAPSATTTPATDPGRPFNPFAPEPKAGPAFNPFLDDADDGPELENPFAPPKPSVPRPPTEGPRKLTLLGRGLAVFGSYAKVLLLDEAPAAYAQIGRAHV